MLIWELLRCINVYTNHPAEAIWGAEDLGTILEYLAPRWRYSAYRRESNPGMVKVKTRGSKPGNPTEAALGFTIQLMRLNVCL